MKKTAEPKAPEQEPDLPPLADAWAAVAAFLNEVITDPQLRTNFARTAAAVQAANIVQQHVEKLGAAK